MRRRYKDRKNKTDTRGGEGKIRGLESEMEKENRSHREGKEQQKQIMAAERRGGRTRWKVNEKAILGKGKKARGGDGEGNEAQEAEKEKKGRRNKSDSNSLR